MTRHVWIVEVRNPRDERPEWRPTPITYFARRSARLAAQRCREHFERHVRVRKYTPEGS